MTGVLLGIMPGLKRAGGRYYTCPPQPEGAGKAAKHILLKEFNDHHLKPLCMISAILLSTLLTAMPGQPFNGQKDPVPATIYDFNVKALDGGRINFNEFRGKKILVVNTASRCGFTPQYGDLEKLYRQFSGKLVIIGFPCNQFGEQEPGNAKEISSFCTNEYQITFPMAAKVEVKGAGTAPIYQWLEAQAGARGFEPVQPQWNFGKYLLDEKGDLVAVFKSPTNPMSKEVLDAVAR